MHCNKLLCALKHESVRSTVVNIAVTKVHKQFASINVANRPDVQEALKGTIRGRIKVTVDKARQGSTGRETIRAAVTEKLTRDTVINRLVNSLRTHDGYNQQVTACLAQLAEQVTPEYAANVY